MHLCQFEVFLAPQHFVLHPFKTRSSKHLQLFVSKESINSFTFLCLVQYFTDRKPERLLSTVWNGSKRNANFSECAMHERLTCNKHPISGWARHISISCLLRDFSLRQTIIKMTDIVPVGRHFFYNVFQFGSSSTITLILSDPALRIGSPLLMKINSLYRIIELNKLWKETPWSVISTILLVVMCSCHDNKYRTEHFLDRTYCHCPVFSTSITIALEQPNGLGTEFFVERNLLF